MQNPIDLICEVVVHVVAIAAGTVLVALGHAEFKGPLVGALFLAAGNGVRSVIQRRPLPLPTLVPADETKARDLGPVAPK